MNFIMILRATCACLIAVLSAEALPFSNINVRSENAGQTPQNFYKHPRFEKQHPLRLPLRGSPGTLSGLSSSRIHQPSLQFSNTMKLFKKRPSSHVHHSRSPSNVVLGRKLSNFRKRTAQKVNQLQQRVRESTRNHKKRHEQRRHRIKEMLGHKFHLDGAKNRLKEALLRKNTLKEKLHSIGSHSAYTAVPYHTGNDDHAIVKKPGVIFGLLPQQIYGVPFLVPVQVAQLPAMRHPVITRVTTSVDSRRESKVPVTPKIEDKPEMTETTDFVVSIGEATSTKRPTTHSATATSVDVPSRIQIAPIHDVSNSTFNLEMTTMASHVSAMTVGTAKTTFASPVVTEALKDFVERTTTIAESDGGAFNDTTSERETTTEVLSTLRTSLPTERVSQTPGYINVTSAIPDGSTTSPGDLKTSDVHSKFPSVAGIGITTNGHERTITMGIGSQSFMDGETTTEAMAMYGSTISTTEGMSSRINTSTIALETSTTIVTTIPSIISKQTSKKKDAPATTIDAELHSSTTSPVEMDEILRTTTDANFARSTVVLDTTAATSMVPSTTSNDITTTSDLITTTTDVDFESATRNLDSSTKTSSMFPSTSAMNIESGTMDFSTFPSTTLIEITTPTEAMSITTGMEIGGSTTNEESSTEVSTTYPSIISKQPSTSTDTTFHNFNFDVEKTTKMFSTFTSTINDVETTTDEFLSSVYTRPSTKTDVVSTTTGVDFNRSTVALDTSTLIHSMYRSTDSTDVTTTSNLIRATTDADFNSTTLDVDITTEIASTFPSSTATNVETTTEVLSTISRQPTSTIIESTMEISTTFPSTIATQSNTTGDSTLTSTDDSLHSSTISEEMTTEMFSIFPSPKDVETTTAVPTFSFYTHPPSTTDVISTTTEVDFNSSTVVLDSTTAIPLMSDVESTDSTDVTTTLSLITTTADIGVHGTILDEDITTEIASTFPSITTIIFQPTTEIFSTFQSTVAAELRTPTDEVSITTVTDIGSSTVNEESTITSSLPSTTMDSILTSTDTTFRNFNFDVEKTTDMFSTFPSTINDVDKTTDEFLSSVYTRPPTTTDVISTTTEVEFNSSTVALDTTTVSPSIFTSTVSTDETTTSNLIRATTDADADSTTLDVNITTETAATFPSSTTTNVETTTEVLSTISRQPTSTMTNIESTMEISTTFPFTVSTQSTATTDARLTTVDTNLYSSTIDVQTTTEQAFSSTMSTHNQPSTTTDVIFTTMPDINSNSSTIALETIAVTSSTLPSTFSTDRITTSDAISTTLATDSDGYTVHVPASTINSETTTKLFSTLLPTISTDDEPETTTDVTSITKSSGIGSSTINEESTTEISITIPSTTLTQQSTTTDLMSTTLDVEFDSSTIYRDTATAIPSANPMSVKHVSPFVNHGTTELQFSTFPSTISTQLPNATDVISTTTDINSSEIAQDSYSNAIPSTISSSTSTQITNSPVGFSTTGTDFISSTVVVDSTTEFPSTYQSYTINVETTTEVYPEYPSTISTEPTVTTDVISSTTNTDVGSSTSDVSTITEVYSTMPTTTDGETTNEVSSTMRQQFKPKPLHTQYSINPQSVKKQRWNHCLQQRPSKQAQCLLMKALLS